MRLGVYTDYVYRQADGAVYAERAFALFLAALSRGVSELVLLGRLDPEPGTWNYRVPEDVRFVGLPHYASLSDPRQVRTWLSSLRRFQQELRDLDVIWLMGPHPLAIAFALIALINGRRPILGVRQDLPEYTRSRHPGRPGVLAAAWVLEGAFRALARVCPVVVVGPQLGCNYRGARRLHVTTVSLIRDADLVEESAALAQDWQTAIDVLSVGRLDSEKNPLLLAEILAELRRGDARWRLTICGDGPMRGELEARLEELGVAEAARLLGYIPIDDGLLDVYRSSSVFLHVSWTEGFPQVLVEAFAAGLPVVATAVGGVPAVAEGRAQLVPAGDRDATVRALRGLDEDRGTRESMIRAGRGFAATITLEAEGTRLLAFLASHAPATIPDSRFRRGWRRRWRTDA
jgi:glycosyltransferase involved in cell wall biosynthesis